MLQRSIDQSSSRGEKKSGRVFNTVMLSSHNNTWNSLRLPQVVSNSDFKSGKMNFLLIKKELIKMREQESRHPQVETWGENSYQGGNQIYRETCTGINSDSVKDLRATNKICTFTRVSKDCVSFILFILGLLGFFRGVLQTVELL